MRIAASGVALDSAHSRIDVTSRSAAARTREAPAAPEPTPPARADISHEARRRAADHAAPPAGPAQGPPGPGRCPCGCGRADGDAALTAVAGDVRLAVTRLLVERLTGRRVEVMDPRELEGHRGHRDGEAPAPAARPDTPRPRPATEVSFDLEEIRIRSERAEFHARGAVTTADGRVIELQVDVTMSRDVFERRDVHLLAEAARRKDPLALSLDGRPVELSPARIAFDLDADGVPENVAVTGPGAAFLALDRDGDGRVTDGTELFGPTSGDGFADLAALDADGDGWIDEDDPAFGDLRLWRRDAAGADHLQGLADAGVGAVGLAHAATPFEHLDGDTVLGATRSTGVYLREDGSAAVVQQVDLAV